MSDQEAEKRLEELHMALKYSSQQMEILTVGERIMINQERGALFRVQDPECTDTEPFYEVSEMIQNKIETLTLSIRRTNWKPEFF